MPVRYRNTGLTAGETDDDKPTLRPEEVVPEALAIVREAMDRNIGIRQIFNPEEDEFSARFDPSPARPFPASPKGIAGFASPACCTHSNSADRKEWDYFSAILRSCRYRSPRTDRRCGRDC